MEKETSVGWKTHYSNAVLMKRLSSDEIIIKGNDDPKPVLRNIDLTIKRGEVWGFGGNSLFEIKLLLEIMANIKPYKDGKCVLLERGMMRLKRIILPHVFYIGTPSMIYNNMNVLEFLMFATAYQDSDLITRQEGILDFLIDIGLGNISLTCIKTLPREYKAIVILIAGFYSASDLIVFNLPEYNYTKTQINAIREIANQIRIQERTLVLSSKDSDLIEEVCSHMAFLIKGGIVYAGKVEDFRHTYDRIIMTIWDEKSPELCDILKEQLPQYDYILNKNRLIISDYLLDNSNYNEIYRKIIDAGFAPTQILINTKRVSNGCKELLKIYDIQ